MIETKANMNGVSVSNYKIVPPRYIAYVSDTSRRGDKMSLGFNRTKETFLVSSISTVFKTDTRYLLPEFLMLYICRDEFDPQRNQRKTENPDQKPVSDTDQRLYRRSTGLKGGVGAWQS